MRSTVLSPQRIYLAVLCIVVVASLVHLQRQHGILPGPSGLEANESSGIDGPSRLTSAPASQASRGFQGVEDVALILKTGATELYEKVPIFFETILSSGVDHVIYSDLGQDFGYTVVRDALSLVSEELREQSEELAQYRSLRAHFANGGKAADLRGGKNWEMDKYKFLPMISDAYHTFGESKKWYAFIEADTYMSLHNLLLWVRMLDSRTEVYAGAQVFIGDTEFAHGGSGFVMSSRAVKLLTETYEKDRRHWEEDLKPMWQCCGDKQMAEVLMSASPAVHLLRTFPMIQGETPASLDWSPKHWCRPAVSWHHVDAASIDQLWQFDREWRQRHGPSRPILFADYYASMVHPRLEAANWTMQEWDNLSRDWSLSADDSSQETASHAKDAAACNAFCSDTPDCVQWVWSVGLCRASRVMKLGWRLENRPRLGSADDRVLKVEGESVVSGWLPERIEQYRRAQEPCGRDPWITENRH